MSDSTPQNQIPQPLSRRLPFAGIVGNGRTCALVDARGRVAWLCVPTFAQFPVFASLLDPVHGGRLELGLRLDEQVFWSGEYGYSEQRYLPGTNVLETTWAIADCCVTIHDAMPRGQDVLVRNITIQGDERASILIRLRPTCPTPPSTRFRVDREGILIEETRCVARGRLVCRAQSKPALVRQDADDLVYEFAPIRSRLTLWLEYQEERASGVGKSVTAAGSIESCIKSDEEWLARAVRISLPDKNVESAFDRSLLALRLLTYEPTGAILAAATASLPSEPNGHQNWDYRYCWVRDGCYTAQVLDLVGLAEGAEGLYRFLAERESNGQWRSPLWAIESAYPTVEEQVAGLYGPGGEKPIRIGNGAALQDQHDSPGNVISGIYRHCLFTGDHSLATRYWSNLVRAADWCCEHWAEAEAGIWERRERNRAWVHGRALCWVALRDAVRLAKLLGKPTMPRWEPTIAEISSILSETGWSEEKGAFLRACGEPSIYDISVLALLLDGLVPPDDSRIRRTVDALVKSMAHRMGFRRDEEDVRYPFYLGTLWMIRAFQLVGEYDRAYAHLCAVVDGATNLDLMGEYFDPLTSRQFGNFPQAFSHEELVRAVVAMLWHFDGERLVLFPAIPSAWLTPGNAQYVSNIPLGGERGSISMIVEEDAIRFAAEVTGAFQVVVPPRYFASGKRIELNGKPLQ